MCPSSLQELLACHDTKRPSDEPYRPPTVRERSSQQPRDRLGRKFSRDIHTREDDAAAPSLVAQISRRCKGSQTNGMQEHLQPCRLSCILHRDCGWSFCSAALCHRQVRSVVPYLCIRFCTPWPNEMGSCPTMLTS